MPLEMYTYVVTACLILYLQLQHVQLNDEDRPM